jgi:type IV pilus assembly protein PilO
MRFGARELVFLAVMLGLLASAYFLVFTKANAKRQALQLEIQKKQATLTDLESSTSGVGDVQAKIDELQKAITFFESKLPQEREIDKILKELWQIADANALQTKTIKTLRSVKTNNFSEQPIEMSLSGDFYGFYTFLQQLEKLPRLTRVMQMNLQKISSRDGEMEAHMTVSIFFEPDSSPAAGIRADAR